MRCKHHAAAATALWALTVASASVAQVVVEPSRPSATRGITGRAQNPGAPGPADPNVDPRAKHGEAFAAAFAQLPNWTGTWQVKDELAIGVFDPETADGAHDDRDGTDFGIAAGGRQHPPYTAEYERIYSERVRKAKEEGFNDDYVSFCRPQGVPRWYATPGEWDMVVLPRIILMAANQMGSIRRIYMDGRGFPDPDSAFPLDMGFSVGRWEGDVLVIETRNMMAGNYDQSGPPYSDDLHMVERIRMLPSGELQADVTLTDLGVLKQPWKVTRILNRTRPARTTTAQPAAGPEWSTITGSYCSGNRNIQDASGNQGVLLRSEDRPPPAGPR